MTKNLRYATIFALCCSSLLIKTIPGAQAESAFSQLAIGPDIGTTGIGVRLSTPLWLNHLTLTAGYSGFGFSYNAKTNGQPWHANCRLGGAPIYGSAYPFGLPFHLDAGLFINQTNVIFSAAMPGTHGGAPGRMNGETHFNAVAPYLGIGWGNPFIGNEWNFTANAGIILEGGAETQLNATDAATMPAVAKNLAEAQNQFNNDLSFMSAFPVFEIGMTYRF